MSLDADLTAILRDRRAIVLYRNALGTITCATAPLPRTCGEIADDMQPLAALARLADKYHSRGEYA